MINRQIKEEAFDITQGDPNVTGANTAAATWGDVWDFKVPIGIGIILMPNHSFSCYLHSLAPAEAEANALVEIVLRDSAEREEKTLLGATLYKTVREFQDNNLKARLSLKEPVKVFEEQHIVVRAKVASGVDVTGGAVESYFDLESIRIRESL